MYNLGRAYQFGNGCIGNMKKALEWYKKAAEVLKDPQIEQRVMAFRSLSQFQPDFDQDYSDEDRDPYDNIPLEGTQYEGRADRCENLRTGTVLQHRISRDKNNQPAIELFHLGGSVGLISSHKSEKIIEFLKKDRITLKVVVKSCVPKSQRGARARNADVRLTLVIDDKLPGIPAASPAKAVPAQQPANRSQAQDNARKEAERKAQEQQRQKEAEENRRRQEAEAKRHQQEAEEAERKKQEALKAMENSIISRRDAESKRFDDEIRQLTEQKNSAEATLASLGFFKFGEKRRQRDIIANTQARLEQTQQEKAKVIPKFDQQLALLKKADQYGIAVSGENDLIKLAICDKVLKDYRRHTISEIMEKCPELEEAGTQRVITILRQMTLAGKVERTEEGRKAYFQLEKPFVATAAPRASAPASASGSRAPTPTQIENDRYKQEILRLLRSGRRYTINEMTAAVTSLGNLTNQRVSAIVRQLTPTGEVIRTEENRIFYFEIGD